MARIFNRIAMSVVAVGLIGSPAASAETMTRLERVASTPKGELKSPYADIGGRRARAPDLSFARLRRVSRRRRRRGHGGALTNQVWIYGNDDDTLFRLITLGSGSLSIGDGFTKQGFVRKGSENVRTSAREPSARVPLRASEPGSAMQKRACPLFGAKQASLASSLCPLMTSLSLQTPAEKEQKERSVRGPFCDLVRVVALSEAYLEPDGGVCKQLRL